MPPFLSLHRPETVTTTRDWIATATGDAIHRLESRIDGIETRFDRLEERFDRLEDRTTVKLREMHRVHHDQLRIYSLTTIGSMTALTAIVPGIVIII